VIPYSLNQSTTNYGAAGTALSSHW
jgi:hypothetical protein